MNFPVYWESLLRPQSKFELWVGNYLDQGLVALRFRCSLLSKFSQSLKQVLFEESLKCPSCFTAITLLFCFVLSLLMVTMFYMISMCTLFLDQCFVSHLSRLESKAWCKRLINDHRCPPDSVDVITSHGNGIVLRYPCNPAFRVEKKF